MKTVRTWLRWVVLLVLFSLMGVFLAPDAHGTAAPQAPGASQLPSSARRPTPTPRPIRQGHAAFEGLVLHQDTQWNYAFWYPKGWLCRDPEGTQTGVTCSPTADDPQTYFSVQVRPLPAPATDVRTAMLRANVQAELSQLPGLHIELDDASTTDDPTNPGWTYTYRAGRELRKGHTELVYDQHTLYIITTQGATVGEYEYWLSMLNYCRRTFQTGRVCIECFDTQGQ